MDTNNLIKIIENLNQELFENVGQTDMMFGYSTTGYYEVITFGDYLLWSSDYDDRNYNEADDSYEEFEPFLKRRFNEFIDKFQKYKFENIK